MKIYIIPCGWDKELVLKTVFKSHADKVCLISAQQKKKHAYSNSDIITQKVNTYLHTELAKFTEVETLSVNYIDLKDIVIEVNKYIKKNKDHDFTINISTGSKLLAATLMLVAQMNNIPIDYSIAQNHNPKIMELIKSGEDYHRGFDHIMQVPSIPFTPKFSTKEKKLISTLKKRKTLTVQRFLNGATGNEENRKRSEFHYLCKKLQKLGFVEIRNRGKKVEVSLTEFGEVFFC